MKKIYLIGCLMIFYAIGVMAQEPQKLVKLSNFDPNSYRSNCNGLPGEFDKGWCYSDLWGYVAIPDDPSTGNREYALFAVSSRNWDNAPAPDHGLSIVEITDPLNPVEVSFIHLSPGYLRDIKTYRTDDGSTFAYVCTDGVGWPNPTGIEIIDLTDLPNNPGGLNTNLYGSVGNLHNIFIDQQSAKLHMVGNVGTGNGHNYGIADLSNPMNPTLEYTEDIYALHDVYAENNFVLLAAIDLEIREYGGAGQGFINDVTFIGDLQTGSLYRGHDVWLSPDGNTVVYNDEHTDKVQFFLDISNLAWNNQSSINVAATNPETVIRHNSQMVSNDFCYTAHYPLGLKIYELSGFPNSASVNEYGYYDTYRESDKNPWYWNGAFGVWPHYPSSYIAVSDMNYGLFVINECVPFRFSSGIDFELFGVNSSLDANNNEVVDNKEVMGWAAEETIEVNPNIDDGFVVSYDGNVTLTAGKSIRIRKGFQATDGGKFHAQIGPVCPECYDSPEGEEEGSAPCAESERAAIEQDYLASIEEQQSTEEEGPIIDQTERPSVGKYDNLRNLMMSRDYFTKVYPNPAKEQAMLEVNLPEAAILQLSLYDLQGKLILDFDQRPLKAGRSFIQLRFPDIAAGVYALKVSTTNELTTEINEVISLTILN